MLQAKGKNISRVGVGCANRSAHIDYGLDDCMDEQASNAIANAGAQLAVLAAKGTATTVANKFQAIRSKKQVEDICNSYEELINELVAERAQAISIANAYESELKRYEITDEDIAHLQQTIENVLDIVSVFSDGKDIASFDQFKSLVSVNTLKAMQLLGFDYKKAIGDPLTEVCAGAIKTKLGQKAGIIGHSQGRKK